MSSGARSGPRARSRASTSGQAQKIAPTNNLDEPDTDCYLDYVPKVARKANVSTVLSNNLGFGGQNAAIVFRAL